MHPSVIIGNAATANASHSKGWVTGHFMPEGSLAETTGFEVKLWEYPVQPDYPPKVFLGTELIVVYGGSLKLEVKIPNGTEDATSETIELHGTNHDYVILPPGCTKLVLVTVIPSFGVTVRWPSAPGNTVIIK